IGDRACFGADKPAFDIAERVAAYRPYDGAGRYTLDKGNGVLEIQGLAELASRWGAKPYADLIDDRVWQTERVIYRDVNTGATIYRLTNDGWMDAIDYFHHNWTADGAYFVFRRKPGMWESSTDHAGPMVMDAAGERPRNAFREFRMERKLVCSPTEKNVVYGLGGDTELVAYDASTGKMTRKLAETSRCWHMKISPDGKYLIVKSREGIEIFSTNGRERHLVPVESAIHDSYWFHPTLRKIIFWYERNVRTDGFVQANFDGSEAGYSGFLMDWNHGDIGPDRHFHTGGHINRIEGATWKEREWLTRHDPAQEEYDDPHTFNGYLSWMPKDELWAYASRLPHKPYVAEILKLHGEPVARGDVVNRFRIGHINALRGSNWLCNLNASPDGTKVLFNSNFLNAGNAFYMVGQNPEPPVGLQALWAAGEVKLSWSPAKHSVETAGYHVYRGSGSGAGYRPLTAAPCTGTEWTDATVEPGRAYYYAVTAVEHSGLESGLSDEAAAASDERLVAREPCLVFAEAERARIETPALWLAFQGTASDLHYIWHRKPDAAGRASLPVRLPRAASYRLWARMKGDGAAQFRIGTPGGEGVSLASEARDWQWVRASEAVSLPAGAQELTLESSTYGSAIDCICLAADRAFAPRGVARDRCDWPPLAVQDLAAEATGPYTVRLTWQPTRAPTLHHYNIYCSADSEVAVHQTDLVASPSAPPFLDWALKPGTRYSYCVTAVDRAGNESPPSPAAEVTTQPIEAYVVERQIADGTEIHVDLDIPRPGPCAVWLEMNHRKGGSYVKVGFEGQRTWQWTIQPDKLSDTSWHTYNEFGIWDLEAGPRRLTITKHSIEHEIKRVLVTNDLSLRPEGHVNIPKGW
ncbi:MAG: fibronectin type III domain-containing protein, partial [Armatimonadota bacterium]